MTIPAAAIAAMPPEQAARALSPRLREFVLAPDPDFITFRRRHDADAFERRGLGQRLYRQAFTLTPHGRDVRAWLEQRIAA